MIELKIGIVYLILIFIIVVYLKATAWKGNFEFNNKEEKKSMDQRKDNPANGQTETNYTPQQPSANSSSTPTSQKDILLAQLHEQYAINNNAGMQSISSILVGLFAVFGGYGYVWLHVTDKTTNTADFALDCGDLFFALIAVFVTLSIMSCICIYQGVSQRLEQFIVYKIREKFELTQCGIFPKSYTPFEKKGLEIVQGLYGLFVNIFEIFSILLCSSFYFKVWLCPASYPFDGILTLCIPVGLAITYFLFNNIMLGLNIRKYIRRCKHYGEEASDFNMIDLLKATCFTSRMAVAIPVLLFIIALGHAFVV